MGVGGNPASGENNRMKAPAQSHTLTNETVLIEARSVWGKTNYYVVSAHAEAISRLTGKRTVDSNDVSQLTMLGFNVRMAGRPEMPASECVI